VSLKRILEPIEIAGRKVRNRVVRTAHATGIGRGKLSDDLIAYHAARARGGVGLSILEILSVHSSSPAPLNMFDPDLDAGYAKLLEEIEPAGMVVYQQLWHGGHNQSGFGGAPPWAPSTIPNPLGGDVPVPMTQAMIGEIVEAFAAAAARCKRAGLHGVEVHGAHGYLLHQFLSASTNRRGDDYGGSFGNRVRFLMEVMRAVRQSAGMGFAVGIRLAPDMTVGGVSVEDCVRVVDLLQQEELVDFVNVSMGNYHTFAKMIGGMHEPVGYELPTSQPVTAACRVPSIVTGRVRTLEEADQIVRQGSADMVGMTRAHIADPDIVAKTLAGHASQVRPCIACNQGCVGELLTKGRMSCAVNPAVGFERRLGDSRIDVAGTRKRVCIVGGGPAGMEAARVAALRGHDVTLLEASPRLGGMVNLAARLPKRHGISDIAVWLEAEILRLGVNVRLNCHAEAADVLEENPDSVIVATGAYPRLDGVHSTNPGEPAAGMEDHGVLSSVDLLSKPVGRVGKSALVVDDSGHYEAIGVAEYLAENGASVTFVTTCAAVAPRVESALMVEPVLERLAKYDFTALTRHRLVSVHDGFAEIAPVYPAPVSRVPAETVVFVSRNEPNRELYDELAGKVAGLQIIGDARSPRLIPFAFREGQAAAMALGE